MGKSSGQNDTTCPYLNNVAVHKKDKTCQGIKMCEFASLEIQEMKHESVDSESDLHLKINEFLSITILNF